jgi:uncharacterized membrane protein
VRNSSASLMVHLKSAFVTGLIAILPLLLTIFVLKWISGTINGYIGPRTMFGYMLQSIGYKFSPTSNLSLAYVIGVLLLVVSILLLGLLLESRARTAMGHIAQRTIFQLPLIRTIYKTTDKFISLMPSGDMDNVSGMQVVFCRFGGGLHSAGVLCLLTSPEVYKLGDEGYVIVMIPTAPIPVGGAMLFVPAASVFSTDLSIDAFAGSYLSMGVTTTHFNIGKPISELANRPAIVEPGPAIAESP